VATVEFPIRRLCRERFGDRLVVGDRKSRPVDRGKAGTVGEKFGQGDPLLAGGGELRPEFRDGRLKRNILFLQRMQGDGGGDPLACRPDEAWG